MENLQREKKIQLKIDTQRKIRIIKEKEEQSMLIQCQQMKDEWLKKTAVLREVATTPFKGDYKDWIHFWNKFSVEVDGSTISKVRKFNYLLELVKGKYTEDILRLPLKEEGYDEAKKILSDIYGKDINFHKQLIKEIEILDPITRIFKLKSIHEF